LLTVITTYFSQISISHFPIAIAEFVPIKSAKIISKSPDSSSIIIEPSLNLDFLAPLYLNSNLPQFALLCEPILYYVTFGDLF